MKSIKWITFLAVAHLSSAAISFADFITCESISNDRHSCDADTRGGVRLVRQESNSDCVAGRTWGYDDLGIWVSGGCRAVFEVNRAYDGRPAYNDSPPPQSYNPPARRVESCPAGFSPSEQRCSPEERRRGCKDIRMDSGLGCVKRR